MTKKQKSAKRAFLSSFLSFVMFFTMFVGTTYAWYNDSVTSGRNTIVSGSLEMVLEVYTGENDGGFSNEANWVTVTDQTKIFKETDNKLTFEPGAVQVAYVRVKNEGDLAFKYSLAAKVYGEETKGTNQAGVEYKLSDYLKFGTVALTGNSPAPFGTREAAIAAVPNATKLQDATLSADDAYLAKGAAPVIVALVIYMPSDVGNDANPQPDKKPEISFGLNALATQYTIERDSFSEDYDGAATMPAVATAPVEANAATTVTAGQVTVEVPADSENADSGDTLRLEVNNFKDDATNGSITMNIELVNQDGDKVTNTTNPMTVKVNVGTGKDITSVKHNGNEVTGYTYDVDTGILTFTTSSFSPFAIEYKIVVASVDGTAYETFSEAWQVAKGKTLKLLRDVTLNALIIDGEYTIDLGGKALTLRGHANAGTTGGAIYIDGGANYDNGNLTIKNGSLSMPGTNFATYGIYNYGTLTLDNVTVNSACDTVIYANGQAWGTAGALTIKDSEITSTKANSTAVAAYALKNFAGTIAPTVTIQGSEINGAYNAVMIYACEANVEGCTITAEENNALCIMRSAMASGVTNTMTVSGNTTINANSDYSRIRAQDGNTISIGEGTYNFNPSAYLADNYTATESNGVWTVNYVITGGGADPVNTPGTGPAIP